MGRSRKAKEVTSSYAIRDERLAQLVEQVLRELQDYPHLDLLRDVFVTGVKLALENCSRGDLKILRASIKELRYGFKVFAGYRDVRKVTIFGSARTGSERPEFQVAQQLARRLAEEQFMVITGAGGGIMQAANQGASRDRSFGLNILLPFEQVANAAIAGDPKLINFRYFFDRKLFFVKESDAIVLLPGGYGTMDEGFEALTLVQTGKKNIVPVVMLDRSGGSYWKGWRRFVQSRLLQDGYTSPQDQYLFAITDEMEVACQEILTFYRRFHSYRYVKQKRNLVLRLKEEIDDSQLGILNGRFADIVVDGRIERCQPFPEEEDEPSRRDLSRLVLSFNQRDFGRLRQLIDTINRL